jgi:hypothetical protein
MNYQYFIPFAATLADGRLTFEAAYLVESQPITMPEQVSEITAQLIRDGGYVDLVPLNFVLLRQFVVVKDDVVPEPADDSATDHTVRPLHV